MTKVFEQRNSPLGPSYGEVFKIRVPDEEWANFINARMDRDVKMEGNSYLKKGKISPDWIIGYFLLVWAGDEKPEVRDYVKVKSVRSKYCFIPVIFNKI